MWEFTGKHRPQFADTPSVNQESVWDYPRPPTVVTDHRLVEVFHNERCIATTRDAVRILETASPPTFYLPPDAISENALIAVAGSSWCEWKGTASYWALTDGDLGTPAVAWSYPAPTRRFAAVADFVSFYPGRIHCTVDGETVRPQPGGFYGGWVTDDIAGPVKGMPGTEHW